MRRSLSTACATATSHATGARLCPLPSLCMVYGLTDSPGRCRKYCANRLHRLHRALGFTHAGAKGRFQPRVLTALDVTDPRCVGWRRVWAHAARRWIEPYGGAKTVLTRSSSPRHLLLPLVNAERAWAHAQELKAAVAQARPDAAAKQHHAVKRLSKAAAWASQLAQLAGSRADARTALEAEAYSIWMAGNVLLEKESDWAAAVAAFLRAQTAYEQLAKGGTSEQAAAARAQLTELGPPLRYCRYKGGSASAAALDALLPSSGGPALLDAGLAAKLEAVADAQRSSASAASHAGDSVELEGASLAVPSSAARVALAAVAALDVELNDLVASGAGATHEARLGLYDKLLMTLADATSAVRGDVTAGGSTSLRGVNAALAVMGLKRTMERDAVLLDQALAGWAKPSGNTRTLRSTSSAGAGQSRRARKAAAFGGGAPGIAASAAQPGGSGRITDVIKLYDTLISNASALADLAQSHAPGFGDAFGGAKAGDAAASALATAAGGEEGVLRCRRASALGEWHARNGRWAEAVALHDRAVQHAATAMACCDQLGRSSAPAAAAHRARISALATSARDEARRSKVLAIVAASEAADAAAAAESTRLTRRVALVSLQDDPDLGLDGADGGAAEADLLPASQRYILDALEVFEPAVYNLGTAAPDVRIFHIPPPLVAVPARPLFLDTALHELPLHSVKHRTGAANQAGATSRLGRLTAGVSSLWGGSRWMGGSAQ